MKSLLTCFLHLAVSLLMGQAVLALPGCPEGSDEAWNDCFGERQEGEETFIGQWAGDHLNGFGVYTNSGAESAYVGEFGRGKFHGYGVFFKNMGTNIDQIPATEVFIGRFSNGKFKGTGYIFEKGGRTLLCDWDTTLRASNCLGEGAEEVNPDFRNVFNLLPRRKREEIQSKLFELKYYDGSVDGLWGQETLLGIAVFQSLERSRVDFWGEINAFIVYDEILAHSGKTRFDLFAEEKSRLQEEKRRVQEEIWSNCPNDPSVCHDKPLCAFATIGNPKKWDNSKYPEHVREAQKRGFSCNVDTDAPRVVEPENEPPSSAGENSESVSDTERSKLQNVASGTGFFVSKNGHIVTNDHVVDGCEIIYAHTGGRNHEALIIGRDRQNDLALLRVDFTPEAVLKLSRTNPKLLQDVYVAGFPFGNRVNSRIKVTRGIVSSLTGVGDNYSQVQIDAAIQPGNSGGPILGENGELLAVAVSKLDLKAILEDYGVIPENTNFGIKSSVVRTLLNGNNVAFLEAEERSLSKELLGNTITHATVFLSCWMTMAQIEAMRE